MGYATHLYSVDIGALQSAVGSNDAALLRRVLAHGSGGKPKGSPAGTTAGPRVKVSCLGELEFNGRPVLLPELKKELLRPDWAGQRLFVYVVDTPRGKRAEGPFKEPGSFFRDVLFKLKGAAYDQIEGCSKEQFAKLDGPPAELTKGQALEELVTGKPSQPGSDHVYGYAIEELCRALGTFLGAVGTDCLRALEIKTPLSKKRSPVRLPRIHDFPVISYLSADELRAEVDRLREMDLAYPSDREIEEERRRFLKLLTTAVKGGRGVVGFYY